MDEQLNKEPGKGRKVITKRKILFVLFLILIGIATLLGTKLLEQKAEDDKEQKQIEELQKEEEKSGPGKLQKKYKDMVGWVKIKGTDFSYPVMKTGIKGHHEEDWQFYLHHDIQGDYSFYGVPFLDKRCTVDSDNVIIYGHNINGRRIFGYLQNFREEDFFKKHKSFYFTRVGSTAEKYDVVSVLETDKYSDYYNFTDYGNEEEYFNAVSKLLKNSKFKSQANEDMEKEMNEETVEAFFHTYKFVTFSTCRTSEGRDKRLLVIGARRK